MQYTDYNIVAEGYGAKGIKMTREDDEKLQEIFKAAQKAAKEGNSVLINCLIGKTNFREGSISV